jgi:protein gp37
MADLFHPAVPDDFLDQVFAVMALAPRHTFQVLTKRPERMLNYLRDRDTTQLLLAADDTRATGCRQPWTRLSRYACVMLESQARGGCLEVPEWPLPNVWLGVSAEDQATADERIPVLLDTPSALCFVSAEPLLGPVAQLWQYLTRKFFSSPGARELLLNGKAGQKSAPHSELDWVIVGGESGPGARPCEVRWIRSIVEQCRDYDVPCFVKQLGAKPVARDRYDMSEEFFRRADASEEGYGDETVVLRLRDRKGGDPDEWPEDLRVRQWPDPPPP